MKNVTKIKETVFFMQEANYNMQIFSMDLSNRRK